MTTPSVSWDENSPAGNSDINLGDNRIREMKTQIREVFGVDHVFASSGTDADNGKHNKISLIEQADLGSGSSGKTFLGAQTVDGKPELVYTDEDDNDIAVTKDGGLNGAAITGDIPASSLTLILPVVYPVGCIYTSVVSTNPGTLFGFGTWTAFGSGRCLVGVDAGQTEFDTVEETGGSKTHTLTVDEMPAHTHTYLRTSAVAGSAPGSGQTQSEDSTASGSAGGGQAHNNLQPYITVYFFKRTA